MSLTPLIDFTIGKEVRVTKDNEERGSQRAIISYINEDNTCDVIYQNTQNEESEVCTSRLFDVLPFEEEELRSMDDPLTIKGYANQLFQLQDYDSAYHYYVRAHKIIQQEEESLSVGQRVIISLPTKSVTDKGAKKVSHSQKQRSGVYINAMVSDITSSDTLDVMYDEEVQGVDEEENVPISRVLMTVSKNTGDSILY